SAAPVGDDAAGAFDHWHGGEIVVDADAEIDVDVGETAGDQAESVALRAVERLASRPAKPVESLLVFRLRRMRRRAEQGGRAQVAARPYMHDGPVMPRRPAGRSDPTFAEGRMIDDAEHRAALTVKRDQRAEQWPTGDEGSRPIDRVQHPDMLHV